jgi:uncharacterized protein YkwD
MKQQLFVTVVFTLVVLIQAGKTSNDDDLTFNRFEHTLTRRYFPDKYLSLRQNKIAKFTAARRKFQNDALDTHNILRAQHCAPPLTLDDKINIKAQAYAEYLASKNSKLIHSSDRHGLLGENLYAVTRTNPITNPDGMYSFNF